MTKLRYDSDFEKLIQRDMKEFVATLSDKEVFESVPIERFWERFIEFLHQKKK